MVIVNLQPVDDRRCSVQWSQAIVRDDARDNGAPRTNVQPTPLSLFSANGRAARRGAARRGAFIGGYYIVQ